MWINQMLLYLPGLNLEDKGYIMDSIQLRVVRSLKQICTFPLWHLLKSHSVLKFGTEKHTGAHATPKTIKSHLNSVTDTVTLHVPSVSKALWHTFVCYTCTASPGPTLLTPVRPLLHWDLGLALFKPRCPTRIKPLRNYCLFPKAAVSFRGYQGPSMRNPNFFHSAESGFTCSLSFLVCLPSGAWWKHSVLW